jgi:hypothetical protein
MSRIYQPANTKPAATSSSSSIGSSSVLLNNNNKNTQLGSAQSNLSNGTSERILFKY